MKITGAILLWGLSFSQDFYQKARRDFEFEKINDKPDPKSMPVQGNSMYERPEIRVQQQKSSMTEDHLSEIHGHITFILSQMMQEKEVSKKELYFIQQIINFYKKLKKEDNPGIGQELISQQLARIKDSIVKISQIPVQSNSDPDTYEEATIHDMSQFDRNLQHYYDNFMLHAKKTQQQIQQQPPSVQQSQQQQVQQQLVQSPPQIQQQQVQSPQIPKFQTTSSYEPADIHQKQQDSQEITKANQTQMQLIQNQTFQALKSDMLKELENHIQQTVKALTNVTEKEASTQFQKNLENNIDVIRGQIDKNLKSFDSASTQQLTLLQQEQKENSQNMKDLKESLLSLEKTQGVKGLEKKLQSFLDKSLQKQKKKLQAYQDSLQAQQQDYLSQQFKSQEESILKNTQQLLTSFFQNQKMSMNVSKDASSHNNPHSEGVLNEIESIKKALSQQNERLSEIQKSSENLVSVQKNSLNSENEINSHLEDLSQNVQHMQSGFKFLQKDFIRFKDYDFDPKNTDLQEKKKNIQNLNNSTSIVKTEDPELVSMFEGMMGDVMKEQKLQVLTKLEKLIKYIKKTYNFEGVKKLQKQFIEFMKRSKTLSKGEFRLNLKAFMYDFAAQILSNNDPKVQSFAFTIIKRIQMLDTQIQ